MPPRPRPVRRNGSITDVPRIAKRRSPARLAVGASASAASSRPVRVVGARATARVPGDRLSDEDSANLGVGRTRRTTSRRLRRQTAWQDADGTRRPRQADAVRHFFGPCVHCQDPHGAVLAELPNEAPNLRRRRRRTQGPVLLLEAVGLGRAVIPLGLNAPVAEDPTAGQSQGHDLVTPLAAHDEVNAAVQALGPRDSVPGRPLHGPLRPCW